MGDGGAPDLEEFNHEDTGGSTVESRNALNGKRTQELATLRAEIDTDAHPEVPPEVLQHLHQMELMHPDRFRIDRVNPEILSRMILIPASGDIPDDRLAYRHGGTGALYLAFLSMGTGDGFILDDDRIINGRRETIFSINIDFQDTPLEIEQRIEDREIEIEKPFQLFLKLKQKPGFSDAVVWQFSSAAPAYNFRHSYYKLTPLAQNAYSLEMNDGPALQLSMRNTQDDVESLIQTAQYVLPSDDPLPLSPEGKMQYDQMVSKLDSYARAGKKFAQGTQLKKETIAGTTVFNLYRGGKRAGTIGIGMEGGIAVVRPTVPGDAISSGSSSDAIELSIDFAVNIELVQKFKNEVNYKKKIAGVYMDDPSVHGDYMDIRVPDRNIRLWVVTGGYNMDGYHADTVEELEAYLKEISVQ
ncbi:MAG: hypothetical protein AAB588_02415 [Patescibacteria group bacterium]